MKSVTAYLTFDGNCRQAMTFYQKCLGGDLQLAPWPDAQGKPSTDPNAGIMHARIAHGPTSTLMASDRQESDSFVPGNNFSVSIDCDSVAEIERLFAALVHGGKTIMPLADAPWGARFGMLTDPFGVKWLLNCELAKK
jgi:PhnB protein